MLSRLVIAFLPRSKRLLISWLQSPSAVISEPKKIKSVTVSAVSPSICHEVMGNTWWWSRSQSQEANWTNMSFFKHRKCCLILLQVIVQFSRSVVSDSLWPHELQHARPPCPSPTPGVHPNSCASSRWCHPAISSSVVPFSSCPQSLPASESFPMSQLFSWGGQSIEVSASASVLPMNIQGQISLGLTGLISLLSNELLKVPSSTTIQKHHFSVLSLLYGPTLTSIHDHWKKNIALTIQTVVRKVMSLLFKWCLGFIIAVFHH